MAEEALLKFFKASLPEELSSLLSEKLFALENCDFGKIFASEDAQSLFGKDASPEDLSDWSAFISNRVESALGSGQERTKGRKEAELFAIGYAALLAFIQSNITGPPLPFSPASTVLPKSVTGDKNKLAALRKQLIQGLSIDGIGAFRLTPNVELLVLAKAILENVKVILAVGPVAQWARLRARMLHLRLLNEVSGTLETSIYADLDAVEDGLFEGKKVDAEAKVQFLLERATVETWCGMDKKAREDLDEAARERGFIFALTGLLGKRTKFQRHDVSQLVVLARSADGEDKSTADVISKGKEKDSQSEEASGPRNLDLNDDTLLESISFTENPAATTSTDLRDVESLPKELTDLDPSNQPLLKPLDSIILLALASSITNTSPADGLTREETLPYAVRVLEGGSSNWQIYTQALLVRSRMEGYKSRTVERGLLQLQAVVDQVIADTASTTESTDTTATSFLPQGSESAPASERLRHVFQLASPSRWELEAELAQRWVQLGGLRSALEIYERLEMWAEAALCYAATEKEEAAKRMIRRQLFHSTSGVPDTEADEDEKWEGEVRDPAPADAARFYCILGDIDNDPVMYEKAWEVSSKRYARAQRSLGRYWLSQRDHLKSADAYAKSLKANSLNQQSWFALGCSLLELGAFEKAAESFRRCVQLDETDAEAWSNLAAALLKNEVPEVHGDGGEAEKPALADDDEDDVAEVKKVDPQQNRKDALRALKRAATLKHESHRIWENLLIISASVYPPDYTSIITAQRQLIDIRGKTVGEKCIDVEIMGLMVTHVVANSEIFDKDKPGYERMLVELFDKHITPLITGSARLWALVAKLALWRGKPDKALEAHEKGWRSVTTQPGWETESVARWDQVVDATVELCDAYESLGPREKTDGLAAGSLVAKDWKFKARSAIRGIMGRGRDSWEDTEGWERLKDALDQLKG